MWLWDPPLRKPGTCFRGPLLSCEPDGPELGRVLSLNTAANLQASPGNLENGILKAHPHPPSRQPEDFVSVGLARCREEVSSVHLDKGNLKGPAHRVRRTLPFSPEPAGLRKQGPRRSPMDPRTGSHVAWHGRGSTRVSGPRKRGVQITEKPSRASAVCWRRLEGGLEVVGERKWVHSWRREKWQMALRGVVFLLLFA